MNMHGNQFSINYYSLLIFLSDNFQLSVFLYFDTCMLNVFMVFALEI